MSLPARYNRILYFMLGPGFSMACRGLLDGLATARDEQVSFGQDPAESGGLQFQTSMAHQPHIISLGMQRPC